MTNLSLAKSYMIKAEKRLKILKVLLDEKDYSDVIREAQEIVELCQKAMLRAVGIDVPKWHDVSGLLIEYKDRFTEEVSGQFTKAAKISNWLRKEREFSFYGDVDFIPTEKYTKEDAERAIKDATFSVELARYVVND